MSDVRKSIDQLKREHDADRLLHGKAFHHRESREDYQLLFPAFNERTNAKEAVYVLASMPWLKFTMPFEEFLERFDEGSLASIEEAELAAAKRADKA